MGHSMRETTANCSVRHQRPIGASFATRGLLQQSRFTTRATADRLKAFASRTACSQPRHHRSSSNIAFPGAKRRPFPPTGTNNAIVWVLDNGAVTSGSPTGPAILHAYNAYNLTNELYNSKPGRHARHRGLGVKRLWPTVATGKVYVGGMGAPLGLWQGTLHRRPDHSPGLAGISQTRLRSRWARRRQARRFTTPLEIPHPTTNSTVYAGAFVLTNTTAVKVLALQGGHGFPAGGLGHIHNALGGISPGFVRQEFYASATRANIESTTYTMRRPS